MRTLLSTSCYLMIVFSLQGVSSQTNPPADVGESAFRLNKDKSYWFGYKNNDEGQLSQSQIGTSDNQVQGVYQHKHPEAGGSRVEYTAGERGFRARGTNIHRQMDLGQVKIPYNPPVSPDSPAYNPTYSGYHDPNEDPSYKFKIRTPNFVKDEVAGSLGNVQGSYTYTDDIGDVHKVDYEAGAGKGFVVKNPVPDNTQTGFFFGGPGAPPRGKTSVQQNEDGSYTFVAQGPNLRRAEKRDNQGRVAGSYSYIDDKGVQKTVSYIAGPETGYQVVSKIPTEFIPLFQSGYFPPVATPVIPFPTSYPKFPSTKQPAGPTAFSTFPDLSNTVPTTFAPAFPSTTTTISPPILSSFPASKPSINQFENDIFGPSSPSPSDFTTASPTPGGGLFSSNKNDNPNKNNFNTPGGGLFTANGAGFNNANRPADGGFLSPQSNIFNTGGYGGSPNQVYTPDSSPSKDSGSDFLTSPNLNGISHNIPVISFPVNPNDRPTPDYASICKVCRSLRDKDDRDFHDSYRPHRPSYNGYSGGDYNRLPHGVAVRAHVQSIDLNTYGPRVPEPGEAIDAIERIDRSPIQNNREVLYTTPSTNLGSSLYNARQNSFEQVRKNAYGKSERIIAENSENKQEVNQFSTEKTQNNIFPRENFGKTENKNSNPELDYFKDLNDFSQQIQNQNSSNASFLNYNQKNDSNNNLFVNTNQNQFNFPSNQNHDNQIQFFNQNNRQENAEIFSSRLSQSQNENVKLNFQSAHQNSNRESLQSHNENYNLQNIEKLNQLNNVNKQKSQKQTGPNLLELFQKELRARPIVVPDLPEENQPDIEQYKRNQEIENKENFEQRHDSVKRSESSETRTERKTPARDRMRRRYSRFTNKENQNKKKESKHSQ